MKSIYNKKDIEVEDKPFPKMMISQDAGKIVLFIESEKGVLVFANGHMGYEVGECSADWCMNKFKDLPKGHTVILSN